MEIGEKCRLKEILASPDVESRLKEMGFCENVEITVLTKDFVCQVCQARFGLCAELAEKIIVKSGKI